MHDRCAEFIAVYWRCGAAKPQVTSGSLHALSSRLGSRHPVTVPDRPRYRGIRVHDDPKNPQRMLIIEHWDSEEIFVGPHMQTPHMQTFLKAAEEFLDGEANFGFWHEIIVRSP